MADHIPQVIERTVKDLHEFEMILRQHKHGYPHAMEEMVRDGVYKFRSLATNPTVDVTLRLAERRGL